VSLFCEALGAVGEAARREPRNAAYLINWANLRQLLGSVECQERHTSGDFKRAAALALSTDPTNTRVLYAAAQLAAWSGDTVELDTLLNRFLLLKTDIRANEVEFVFSNMLDGGRVERIVPPRFPHVVRWAAAMRERKPELYRSMAPTWERLQVAAVEESKAELVQGVIPLELHRRRLGDLGTISASSVVQNRADTELADIYRRRGAPEIAQYYGIRSQLEAVTVVRAVQKADTRPAATPLVAWGSDDIATFDEFFTTVGFFVPVGFQPRLVELSAAAAGAALDGAVVQVLASNDNATWVQLSDRVKVSAMTLAEFPSVALQLDGGSFRYWKIHFGSSERPRVFRNALSKLVKVYGVRWTE
jgi:hypothetical protein